MLPHNDDVNNANEYSDQGEIAHEIQEEEAEQMPDEPVPEQLRRTTRLYDHQRHIVHRFKERSMKRLITS